LAIDIFPWTGSDVALHSARLAISIGGKSPSLSPHDCRGDPAIVENVIVDERESEERLETVLTGHQKSLIEIWTTTTTRWTLWMPVPELTPTLTLSTTRSHEEYMV
jgi:hypothetical protein